MKRKQLTITPHTIFIYSHGTFLRIVRGEHDAPETTIKPRTYSTLTEALVGEHKARILKALRLFPTDKLLDKRLKKIAEPVKIESYQPLAKAIRSIHYLFAQIGYDTDHKEIAYIYHRNPMSSRGMTMVKKGPVWVVRQLLKKYRKPLIRELNYRERKPRHRPSLTT
jgi:hypothetical protein